MPKTIYELGRNETYFSHQWTKMVDIESEWSYFLDPEYGDEPKVMLSIIDTWVLSKDKILEAGCGLGKYCKLFLDRGNSVTGFDTEFAPLVTLKSKLDCPLFVGDVTSISGLDEMFDIYFSGGVFEHLPAGPTEALIEAKRVLKNNGILLLFMPQKNLTLDFTGFVRFLWSLKNPTRWPWLRRMLGCESLWYDFMQGRWRYGLPVFFEYLFKKKEIVSFVRQAGFRIESVLPCQEDYGFSQSFPWLRAPGSSFLKPRFTSIGNMLKRILRGISPWLYCMSVAVIAKKI